MRECVLITQNYMQFTLTISSIQYYYRATELILTLSLLIPYAMLYYNS